MGLGARTWFALSGRTAGIPQRRPSRPSRGSFSNSYFTELVAEQNALITSDSRLLLDPELRHFVESTPQKRATLLRRLRSRLSPPDLARQLHLIMEPTRSRVSRVRAFVRPRRFRAL